ncbi:MAG TPA: serine hydrolase domain-containing protein [Symbiobacteriaceae bacterium]|nr:serine hydrolase domain-containing protein [Symbiobacteriaceae bacterium]
MRLLVPLLLLFAVTAASPALATPDDPFAAALETAMPGLLKAYDVPGAAVAYISNGEVAWSRGYGFADKERKTPMTGDHILAHGSNGKVIAAWAVLRLVDEGKVDLNTPAERYLKRWQFPASPFDASKITVRHLLTHTSGLEPGHYRVRPIRFGQVGIVDSLNGRNYGSGPVRLAREPGSQFSYSGAGFAVAQALVEDVTGESFEAYTERVIFRPLGMASAAWHWSPSLEARAAIPYGAQGERLPYYDLSEAAVGSEMMTVADFARFVAAAVPGPGGEAAGRGVLKPETVAMSMTVQPATNGTCGLGYGIDKLQNGKPFVMHLGGDPGWRAAFALQPESRTGFVVAANSSRADNMLLEIMDVWSRAALGTPLPLAPGFQRTVTDAELPLRNLLLVVTVLLGLGLLLTGKRVYQQARDGGRAHDASRTSRAVALSALYAALAVAWLLWNHTDVPVPGVPASWVIPIWTPEIRYVTAAVLAWACLGMAAAWFPKSRVRSEAMKQAG